MAQALYDYWFVQFDFPDENGKPYKSSGGKMVWNEVLKREIPEGWTVEGIDATFTMHRGVSYKPEEASDSPLPNYLPVLRANNINFGTIQWGGLVYVNKERINSKQAIKKHDVIIVMSSGSKEHVGKIAAAFDDLNCSYGAFCAKLTPKQNCSALLRTALQASAFRLFLKQFLIGTNINNISLPVLQGYKIAFPQSKILERFQRIVGALYEKAARTQQENKILQEQRDFLLPLLMNGQVQVKPQGVNYHFLQHLVA